MENMNSGTALINDADLYYEVKGKGTPLLMIHAGIADCRMWDTQFEELSKHYQVIRFDLRGFGQSNMPSGSFSNCQDACALLDFLKIDSAHIIGSSFGGGIALDMALAYPQYVKSLILVAPSVGGMEVSDTIKEFWKAEEAAIDDDKLDFATELNLKFWVDGPNRSPIAVKPEIREQVRIMQLDTFNKDIPDDIEELDLKPTAMERLEDIEIPVQVWVGDKDLPEKMNTVNELAERIPNCSKVVLPRVGHMLSMEKPEFFNHKVIGFLAEID